MTSSTTVVASSDAVSGASGLVDYEWDIRFDELTLSSDGSLVDLLAVDASALTAERGRPDVAVTIGNEPVAPCCLSKTTFRLQDSTHGLTIHSETKLVARAIEEATYWSTNAANYRVIWPDA